MRLATLLLLLVSASRAFSPGVKLATQTHQLHQLRQSNLNSFLSKFSFKREKNDKDREETDDKIDNPNGESTPASHALIVEERKPELQTSDKSYGSKLRRLKDLMWVRETLEDCTAAEFASTVESGMDEDDRSSVAGGEVSSARRRKRAVDYEKLITQLNRRLYDLGCEGPNLKNKKIDDEEDHDTVVCQPTPGKGMGSIVYTDEQRTNLLERILRARSELLKVMRANELDVAQTEIPFSRIKLPELPELRVPKEQDQEVVTNSPGPKLYVRDDGTVDWDGALQDQAALRKFGTAVWARINGQDPETIEDDEPNKPPPPEGRKKVTAKIEETPQIVQAREHLREMKEQLKVQESEHTALLTSAIRAGQAVANVRLASLEPELRNTIRESAEALELIRERVTLSTLVYELERVYTYLLGEIGNPALNGYIPLQDRLNVAEFGLLESQIDNFNRQLEGGETVDADVLAVVMDQLTEFKRRLGIDYYVTGVTFDREGIKRWLYELFENTKKGIAFYVKGVQLFWNDIVFCLSLINRAAQGYTLKPREVRTIRYETPTEKELSAVSSLRSQVRAL